MQVEAVLINGSIYRSDEAVINAIDRGFMFGHGAFETFRVSAGRVFLYEEHFARLDKNLKALDIEWTYENKHREWIGELARKIPEGRDGRVRFCVTSGVDGGQPSVIIYLSHIDKFRPAENNAQVIKSVARHKPEYFETTGFRIKSLEYYYIYMARKELKNSSDAGILLNPDGYVAEALTSNIFWVKDGTIHTSPLSLGILAGTVRNWLINNFNVEEKLAKKEELFQADEIFLTAGASYLVAISEIDGIKKPGLKGEVYNTSCEALLDQLTGKAFKL